MTDSNTNTHIENMITAALNNPLKENLHSLSEMIVDINKAGSSPALSIGNFTHKPFSDEIALKLFEAVSEEAKKLNFEIQMICSGDHLMFAFLVDQKDRCFLLSHHKYSKIAYKSFLEKHSKRSS